ncbi:CheR family methyltransferase [Geobacter argillaceus]|uniref:protein-glutamate O-methyltransferase n=1 Tax=Geobacter argillaceus TaxID=345631 RepID=A0A562WSW2_9BACT|nr:protein-glutamate O-methyltransferase CheR [Geobacter argillaceus]TWJ33446.1 CheR-type MCP methyltransferase [Geobacter argillaceus]
MPLSAPHTTQPVPPVIEIGEEELLVIQRLLKEQRGFRLDGYKDKCVRRRISIRIRANHCATVREYCSLLTESEVELDRLLKVLTIHVSQFYRNPPMFEKLGNDVLPSLMRLRSQEGRVALRVWSVGCAGGEEPYTLAMVLRDLMPSIPGIDVEIVATDIEAMVLAAARQGSYVEERLAELPPSFRNAYFTQQADRYQLKPEILQMVSFRQADMFDTDAYEECDLILCRNVLIYFERVQQERIIRNFARVLRPGGILVLGKSETLFGENRRLFQAICPVERIYRVVK